MMGQTAVAERFNRERDATETTIIGMVADAERPQHAAFEPCEGEPPSCRLSRPRTPTISLLRDLLPTVSVTKRFPGRAT